MLCFSYRGLHSFENSGIDQKTFYWMNYKVISWGKGVINTLTFKNISVLFEYSRTNGRSSDY